MKIDPSNIYRLIGAYKAEKSTEPKQKAKNGEADQVLLSDTAQSFQVAFKAAIESADIRTAKVNEIKAAFDAGQYKVDASKIADSIIDSALGKK